MSESRPSVVRGQPYLTVALLIAIALLLPLLPRPVAAGPYDWQVQQMYVAYYGRPGDPAGLDYWAGRLAETGGNWFADVVNAFGISDEYTSRFAALGDETLINNLYRQLFNRAAEPAGLDFYVDLLNGTNASGLNPGRRRSTLAQIALDIANGAQNDDLIILENKLEFAQVFTEFVQASGYAYTAEHIRCTANLVAQVDLSLASVDQSTENPRYCLRPIYGLNFSPYLDGQDPNEGVTIPEEQLRERMAIVAGKTEVWLRCFGTRNGLEKCGAIAREFGLKAAVGAWLSNDLDANERQIDSLVRLGQAGEVDLAIVGSEVLLRGDLSSQQLLAYMVRVKQALPHLPVATADAYRIFLDHPELVAASDVILANLYPYWEGIGLADAVAAVDDWVGQLRFAAGDKPVMVSETGWPSCGDGIGEAVPSPENAAVYLRNFVSLARSTNIEYFYFEAFDQDWKALQEGPQGACWGIWDREGVLKPGVQTLFDGNLVADNWSGDRMIGGPGEPGIRFSRVPSLGSFDDLEGQVVHVRPSKTGVAVYIRVNGRWYIKPTLASPVTPIDPDGHFFTDITTGGVDEQATAIAVFLIPRGYSPPAVFSGLVLPDELYEQAVASIQMPRFE